MAYCSRSFFSCLSFLEIASSSFLICFSCFVGYDARYNKHDAPNYNYLLRYYNYDARNVNDEAKYNNNEAKYNVYNATFNDNSARYKVYDAKNNDNGSTYNKYGATYNKYKVKNTIYARYYIIAVRKALRIVAYYYKYL